ncbi:MAG TPA: hypothetical protein VFS00_03700 [Polyangiaceae bacterium]|nr:hypothetical protein [Polyangiaceae bacterium]
MATDSAMPGVVNNWPVGAAAGGGADAAPGAANGEADGALGAFGRGRGGAPPFTVIVDQGTTSRPWG